MNRKVQSICYLLVFVLMAVSIVNYSLIVRENEKKIGQLESRLLDMQEIGKKLFFTQAFYNNLKLENTGLQSANAGLKLTRDDYEAKWIAEMSKPPVEKITEVPVALDDWKSLDELKEFLDADNTQDYIFYVFSPSGEYDKAREELGYCWSYAYHLRDSAMAKGKYLAVQILSPEDYTKWYGRKITSYHAICMARVNRIIWFIEPQTDEIRKVAGLF